LKIEPQDRSGTNSYLTPIVTMTVSCIAFEIKQDRPIGPKAPIFHAPFHLTYTVT